MYVKTEANSGVKGLMDPNSELKNAHLHKIFFCCIAYEFYFLIRTAIEF